jgi:hypothetical protein
MGSARLGAVCRKRCREKARPAQQTVAFRRGFHCGGGVCDAAGQQRSIYHTNSDNTGYKTVPPHYWPAAGPGPWRFSVGWCTWRHEPGYASGCCAFPLADGQKSAAWPGNGSDLQTVVHMAYSAHAQRIRIHVSPACRVGHSYFRWWIPPNHLGAMLLWANPC